VTQKLCPRCAETLPRSEFGTRSNGRPTSWCKGCHRDYNAEHYEKNKDVTKLRIAARRAAVIEEYRAVKEATPCTDCGQFFPFYVTQYDHIDADKVDDVATIANDGSRRKLFAEIAKCELVCANCHAIRTYRRRCEDATDEGLIAM
jgi:hypothetical protein